MFDKISFDDQNSASRYSFKGKDLNKYLSSQFRIYRMFTSIWYQVVLDQDMLSKLQHALSDQIQLLHENIISHQIDDGPEGDVEDIKIVIRKFMQLMLDISLNENSIHYLLHSHVVLDHTYEIFEDLILNFVWTFIKST